MQSELLRTLIDRWEESRANGHELSPTELCRSHPELETEVRQWIADLQSMDWLERPAEPVKTPAETLAGKTFGEYVLQKPLGSGGMGQVFLARHERMDRSVALKLLSPAALQSKDSRERFHREVRAAARLIHPNIVTAFDAGEKDGAPYLVMEYIPGHDLGRLIEAQGPLPLEKVIDYLRQTARGLAFAHAQGVIHRDIKPANLLLHTDGTIKILDMGLARVDQATNDQLTNTGQVMGTVDYMAPEQAYDTRQADARSDLYSLGCTLHRLLTGKPVFAGETVMQKLLAHRNDPPPSLRATNPQIPAALDEIFQRLVAKQPADRFQTTQELLDALDELQTPAPPPIARKETSAKSISPTTSQNTSRFSRLHLTLALVIALSLPVIAWQVWALTTARPNQSASTNANENADPSSASTDPVTPVEITPVTLLGNWQIVGKDDGGTTWSGDLVIRVGPKGKMLGTVKWSGTGGWGDGASGIERISVDFAADSRRVTITGTSLIASDRVGLGVYVADISADGDHLENGTWKNDGGGGTFEAAHVTDTPSTALTPAVAATALTGDLYLDDLAEKTAFVYGELGKHGHDFEGHPFKWQGSRPAHALFAHPRTSSGSHVIYFLEGHYSRLKVTAAISDEIEGRTSVPLTFRVIGDQKVLRETGELQLPGESRDIVVPLTGVRHLRLEVYCPGFSGQAHALWLNPRLTRVGAEETGSKKGKKKD